MIKTNCSKCGAINQVPPHYLNRAVKCPKCGSDYTATAQEAQFPRQDHTARPVRSQKGSSKSALNKNVSPWVLVGVVVFGLAAFLGSFHVITGGSVGPKITSRESFGFSEIFINVDKITGMPWISAKSQYPLGCLVLAREDIIESDSEFKDRTKRKIQREIDDAMQDVQKKYDKRLRDLQQ